MPVSTQKSWTIAFVTAGILAGGCAPSSHPGAVPGSGGEDGGAAGAGGSATSTGSAGASTGTPTSTSTGTSSTTSTGTSSTTPTCYCPGNEPDVGLPCDPQPGCVGLCFYDGYRQSTTSAGVLSGPGCGPRGFVCAPAQGGTFAWALTVDTLCSDDPLGCAKEGDRMTCIDTQGCRWLDNHGDKLYSFLGACFPAADCSGPSDCTPGSFCAFMEPAGLGVTLSGDTPINAHVCAYCSASQGPCRVDADCCSDVCVSGTCA